MNNTDVITPYHFLMLIFIVLAVLLLYNFGHVVGQNSISKSCKQLGAFSHDDKVYECRVKTTIQ